jgi:hypothetical protein
MRLAVGFATVVACSVCVAVAMALPVPAVETQRIVAEFGRTYVPSAMPAGYIYVRWSANTGSADVFGDALEIYFGRRGRLITWTVEDWHDPQARSYYQCARHNSLGDKVMHVSAKTVYYIGGAVGQSATVCLPDDHAIVVWNRYSVSALTLARLAATARRIG